MNAPAILRPVAKAPAANAAVEGSSSLASALPPAGPPRLLSRDVFQGARLVVIEHEGSEYRLQITGRGKLILTR